MAAEQEGKRLVPDVDESTHHGCFAVWYCGARYPNRSGGTVLSILPSNGLTQRFVGMLVRVELEGQKPRHEVRYGPCDR